MTLLTTQEIEVGDKKQVLQHHHSIVNFPNTSVERHSSNLNYFQEMENEMIQLKFTYGSRF